MNKFLGGHKLLKFNYEYIESLNTLVANIRKPIYSQQPSHKGNSNVKWVHW